ncbi:MAG: DNA mismatch repair endonuclease MutL, partial [Lachnospiraceae bacterium]|nr:DNA mismatch repair endonuclease MutL [Lachnospiraceae bacterium]
MTIINRLSKDTIDKIAAGEVIERPASIVKELVENAIDAGANAVTVEIREGGISFLRVTDNGQGIDASQVRTAFLRHATSKISSAQDLESISSLGFRGEALASICAISQMEVITKTPASITGVRYVIEGSEEISFQEIGAPQGSTFLVRNIFYNTPARKKFLKSSQTEAGYISDLMEHLALSHPEISFKFISNGQNRLYTSGNGQVKDIIYGIYGRETSRNLLEVDSETDGIHLRGYIGKPAITRGNRSYENYYVNDRYVRSNIVARGIEDGYKGFLMQHRYPFTVLYLTMDGSQVDINVHPAKMEVRFADGEKVYTMIRNVLSAALAAKEMIPEASPQTAAEERKEQRQWQAELREANQKTPEPFERLRRDLLSDPRNPYEPKYPLRTNAAGTAKTAAADGGREKTVPVLTPGPKQGTSTYAKPDESSSALRENEQGGKKPQINEQNDKPVQINEQNGKPVQMELDTERLLSGQALHAHRLIGQVFDTYWLVEYQKKLYIIDQHAAHEKVMYERLISRFKKKQFTSQAQSPPQVV